MKPADYHTHRRALWLGRIRGVLYAMTLLVALTYFGYCARLVVTCEGHVLKNAFDWPVCVK